MARSVNAPFLRAGPLLLDRVAPEPRTGTARDAGEGTVDACASAADDPGTPPLREPARPRAKHPLSRRRRRRTPPQE